MNFIKYYNSNKTFKVINLENYKREDDIHYEEYQINIIVAITGVPFCKQSRLNRLVKIDRSDRYDSYFS